MAYNRISIKPYIKSHLELQREITQIELAPSFDDDDELEFNDASTLLGH